MINFIQKTKNKSKEKYFIRSLCWVSSLNFSFLIITVDDILVATASFVDIVGQNPAID